MQLKALHLGILTVAGAVLLAAAPPTPHAAAQAADDPATPSVRKFGQEGCWYDAGLILRSTEDRLTLAYWLGEAYEDRTCVRETVGAALEDYRRSVDDANAGGPAAAQDAFERRALDLVSANARLRKFMLEIASSINSEAFLKDVETRIAWIEEIEGGDPRVLYETALRVRDGEGLPQQRDAAVTWLERAGDHGVPEALYAAARMELDDLGEGPAAVIGEDLLERAARRNVVEAQKEFGLRLVAQGAHLDYLYFNAYAWLLLAEANGEDVDDDLLSLVRNRLSEEERQNALTKVQRALGRNLPPLWPRNPGGEAEDWRERLTIALRWDECGRALSVLDGARRDGEAAADHELAELYDDGICVEQDFGQAFGHYLLAARGGYPFSTFPLSLMYYDGRGTPKDLVEARYWFRASALTLVRSFYDPGERPKYARNRMPERYYDNLPPELIAEIDWLAEIEDSDPRALFETALRVRDGNGLPRDRFAALNWFQGAAQRGLPEAGYVFGLDLLDDPPLPDYLETGIKALAEAGRDGFVPAQVEMGRRYATGDQVQQWDHAAYVWLLMATGNGADVAALLEEVGGRLSDQELQTARAEAEKGTYYPLDVE